MADHLAMATSSVSSGRMWRSARVIATAVYEFRDVSVHGWNGWIIRTESSVTPNSLTESRNGTTVPVMSIRSHYLTLQKLNKLAMHTG